MPAAPLALTASADSPTESSAVRMRAMVERHFDLVWRCLRRLGVASASVDDAAQQVFIIANRKLETIDPAGERAYLLGIAYRVASDTRRTVARRREVTQNDDPRTDPTPPADELVDRKRARELLDRILETMAIELRAPFTLFELEGLTVQEVAEILAIPIGTVGSRLRRARTVFQEQLAALEIGRVRADSKGGSQ